MAGLHAESSADWPEPLSPSSDFYDQFSQFDDDIVTIPASRPATPPSPDAALQYSDLYGPTIPDRQTLVDWLLEPLSPEDRLARAIVFVLLAGLVACPPHLHLDAEQSHSESCSKHVSISETAGSPRPNGRYKKTLAEESAEVGLQRTDHPIPSALKGAPRPLFPHHSFLQRAFSGLALEPLSKAQVCLHLDHSRSAMLGAAVLDIDSHLLVFRDLAILQGAAEYIPTPSPTGLLSKSIHLQVPFPYELPTDDGGTFAAGTLVPVHRIPHLVFLRVGTVPVYLFLPVLFRPPLPKASTAANGRASTRYPVHVSSAIHRTLFESIVHPAIRSLGSSFAQHCPATFEDALARSKAYKAERHGQAGAHGQPKGILLNTAAIQAVAAALGPLLSPDRDRDRDCDSAAGSTAVFAHAFFLYDRKGFKMGSKADSVAACLDGFEKQAQAHLALPSPPASFHGQYIDLAAEFQPKEYPSTGQHQHNYAVLARRCCQLNTQKLLAGRVGEALLGDGASDAPLAGRAHTTEYPVYLLRDSVTLTSEPRPSSEMYRHGVRYIHSYAVAKEAFDAYGTYPFTHPGIVNLAYGCKDWEGISTAAHTTADRMHASRSLVASCQRMYRVLRKDAVPSSTGWRFEIRLTPELARRVRAQEQQWYALLGGAPSRPEPAAPVPADVLPDAYYMMPASTFNGFLYANLDKTLRAMDYIRAYYSEDLFAPQSAVSLFGILAHYLSNFARHSPPHLAAMLNSPFQERVPGHRRPGLGLAEIRDRHGFAFLPDLADWRKFTLQERYFRAVTVPSLQIHRSAVRQYQQSKSFLEQLLDLVTEPGRSREHVRILIEAIVDLLLRAFRADAASKLLPTLADQHRQALVQAHPERTVEDAVEFTLAGLEEAAELASQYIAVATSNRKAIKTADDLFRKLWDPAVASHNITTLPYFAHFGNARARLLAPGVPPACLAELDTLLFHRFFQQHPALPLPIPNKGLSQITKSTRTRPILCFQYIGRNLSNPSPHSRGELVTLVNADQAAAVPIIPRPAYLNALREIADVEALLQSHRPGRHTRS
ncbi:hypothetical protein GQ53DRAFT_118374 [Thozetella sp. PMI_491]|nr:hypothetical protein GQ53DRAFT_118374 [Thozetella sp. PMI_491]